jgi:hypothetical protein
MDGSWRKCAQRDFLEPFAIKDLHTRQRAGIGIRRLTV